MIWHIGNLEGFMSYFFLLICTPRKCFYYYYNALKFENDIKKILQYYIK